VNVVMNFQVPQNAGNVACFILGRAKDLSAPLYEFRLEFHVKNDCVSKWVRGSLPI